MSKSAAEVRAGLSHPIIDADGHFVELGPVFEEEMLTYLEEMGGARGARPLRRQHGPHRHDDGPRDASRCARPGLAGHAVVVGLADEEHPRPRHVVPARAALRTPRRDRHRLHDPVSVDDALVPRDAPTTSSSVCGAAPRTARSPTSTRRTATARPSARSCRCSTRSTRSTSSSTRCASSASRPRCSPVTPAVRSVPTTGRSGEHRLDTFGVDSAYDYDPVWAKCVELGVAPVFHSSLQSHRVTRSATSYVYNHIGGLAASHESLCKSLFLVGRHPPLPDAALRLPRRRRGAGPAACSPTSSATGRSATRDDIRSLDPDLLDVDALVALFDQYGDDRVRSGLDRAARVLLPPERAPGAARRVRGGRAALGRRAARQVRAELLLRLRGRRPAGRVGVRRAASIPPARGCARSSVPTSRTGTCRT